MKKGTCWTETDVREDSWYLHDGHMPAGIMVESGQADLFLISYLGADFLNRGERAYRLLGCEMTCHGDLPKIGETLAYDIHVDGHAAQGDVRLFFFHYDCHVRRDDGTTRPALSVRGGQAGFFTEGELAESDGILWKPEGQEIVQDARVDAPAVASRSAGASTREAGRGVRRRPPLGLLRPGLSPHQDAYPHAAHPRRTHALPRHRRARSEGRALGPRLSQARSPPSPPTTGTSTATSRTTPACPAR